LELQRRFYVTKKETPKDNTEKVDQPKKFTIQKYLKSFLLKVHPDFYQQFPEMQKNNQESLQKLNNLLEIGKAKQISDFKIPSVELSFWVKNKTDIDPSKFKRVTTKIDMKPLKEEMESITTFGFKSFVEQRIEEGLYNLFAESGIKLPPEINEVKTRKGLYWETHAEFLMIRLASRTKEKEKQTDLQTILERELKKVISRFSFDRSDDSN
jgi:hypothetical protein